MDWFRRWLHAHKDPLLVWNFQKTFGVEKVRKAIVDFPRSEV